MSGWIDTHHHIVPEAYAAAVEAAGGDPNGFSTPIWSHASARETMAALGIAKAFPSVTAPGAVLFPGEQGRKMARELNEHSHKLVEADAEHFPGYFLSLPSLNDVEGVLREIDYAFAHLAPAGVCVFTSYPFTDEEGGPTEWRYLGHPAFAPIWDALAKRKAVVFVHPSETPSPRANQYLLGPIMDFPHETARAAMDLIIRGVVVAHPELRFILSHAGGTLPMVANRVALVPKYPVSKEQILASVSAFYYDVALSTAPAQLKALLEVTTPDHIFFGSDTPYAPFDSIRSCVERLKEVNAELLDKITRTNVLALFPSLQDKIGQP